MAGRRGFGDTGRIMNDAILPASLFTIHAEPGQIALALFISLLTVAFLFRMERRSQK